MFVVADDIRYHKLAGIRIMDYFIDDPEVFWDRVQEPEEILYYLEAYLQR